jgi:4-carboxymuconolactone decarboxylase
MAAPVTQKTPARKIGRLWPVPAALAGLLLSMAAGEAQAPNPPQQRPGLLLTAPTTPSGIEAAKPNPQAPGFRIPFPPLDQMEPAQRAEFEQQSKSFYTPIGPRVPLMVSPDVSAAWASLSSALQKSALPQDLFELTIIVVSREWAAPFEWWVHAPQAVNAGVPADAVEAIRLGRTPTFTKPGQEATYRYLTELLRDHRVSDSTYARLHAIIGTRQLVELTVLAGHYTNVAMTLVAHNVPLRADVPPPFPPRSK